MLLLPLLFKEGDSAVQPLFEAENSLLQPFFNKKGSSVQVFFNRVGLWLSFLLVGLIQRDELKGHRWVLLSRVSTGKQLDGMSSEAQLGNLEQEADQTDGEVIQAFEGAESAATVARETLEEIATLAECDQFDILGVWKLDRLTRADPWDSIAYLRRLKDANIILYAGTHGYFDWKELYDFQMVIRQVVFAREWYERIRQNAREGVFRHLQNGKWPYGQPGFGFTTDKQRNVQVTSLGEEVIPTAFEIYLETENRAETRRRINDAFDFTGDEALTDETMKTLLENRLCIGQLAHKGEVINEIPELAVVDKEVFVQTQDILKQRRVTSRGISHVPEWLDRAAERFGPDFTISQIEGFSLQCPKCSSDLRHYGSTKIKSDKQVRTYECKGDDCKFVGPLISEDAIDKFHQALPLRCPFCPATEIFKVEEMDVGLYDYRYTCRACDLAFGANATPDRLKRGLQCPALKSALNREIWVEATEREAENHDHEQPNSRVNSRSSETGTGHGDEHGSEPFQKSPSSF
jgi:DNA invertase Pin-like site-specific DNA recombinase